ncbi:hypothetical protein BDN72DRAFT_763558, partial [Pluteus cervinus]
DWRHNAEWVGGYVERMMLPPLAANPSATMAIRRVLKAMSKEREVADSLRDLGWYMPEEFVGDNIFQRIMKLHWFGPALPLRRTGNQSTGVNSSVFEIRFPPAFPNPPLFCVQGGGGHIAASLLSSCKSNWRYQA